MNILLNPLYYAAILIAIPVYWIVIPRQFQITFVCLLSCLFLVYLHPVFFIVIALLSYLITLCFKAYSNGRAKGKEIVLLAIVLGVGVLACGKYLPQIIKSFFSESDWVASYVLVPLGISYFFFRIVGLLFGIVRGYAKDISFLKVITYLTFIPIFPAGPLETYWGFYQKRMCVPSKDALLLSIRRVFFGLFKKLMVIDILFPYFFNGITAPFFDESISLQSLHPLAPILFCIIMFLKAYIDISAYTDIAIGISGLFGFSILEDLNYPLFKPNLAEFWRSWHISVMNWCRDNVYFPVFASTRKVWLGLYASLGVMGLWHNVSLNWFAWGMYQATGLYILHCWNIYKKKNKKIKKIWHSKPLRPLGYVITFLFATFSFALMSPYSFDRALSVAYGFLAGPFTYLNIF